METDLESDKFKENLDYVGTLEDTGLSPNSKMDMPSHSMDLTFSFSITSINTIFFPNLKADNFILFLLILIFFIILAIFSEKVKFTIDNYSGVKNALLYGLDKFIHVLLMVGFMTMNFWVIFGIVVGSSLGRFYVFRRVNGGFSEFQ